MTPVRIQFNDLVYDVNAGNLDPLDESTGIASRLGHLGYAISPEHAHAQRRLHGGKDDEGLARALKAFQKDHDLSETGIADDATRDALKEAHGSSATHLPPSRPPDAWMSPPVRSRPSSRMARSTSRTKTETVDSHDAFWLDDRPTPADANDVFTFDTGSDHSVDPVGSASNELPLWSDSYGAHGQDWA